MMAIQERVTRRENVERPPVYPVPATADIMPNAEEDEYYSILDYMRRNGKFINRR